MQSSGHSCPICRDRLSYSRPRWYDLFLFVLLLRPYRCPTCYRRFYRVRSRDGRRKARDARNKRVDEKNSTTE